MVVVLCGVAVALWFGVLHFFLLLCRVAFCLILFCLVLVLFCVLGVFCSDSLSEYVQEGLRSGRLAGRLGPVPLSESGSSAGASSDGDGGDGDSDAGASASGGDAGDAGDVVDLEAMD
jgi:hypothetical protein